MSDSLPAPTPPSWRARAEQVRLALPFNWTPKTGLALSLAIVGVVAIAAVGTWFLLRGSPAPAPIDLPRADAAGSPGGAGAGAATSGTATSEASAGITVAAAGAVVHPGVYVVPSKSRVADVVAAAGGTLPEADLDQVNLAAKVADADRVFVPRKGQPVPPVAGDGSAGNGGSTVGGSPSGSADKPVDLNTATAEQLDALPGVGPATAQAILAYRLAHGGRFKSVNELLEVRGIGPAKFDALRALVRVA